MAKPKTATVGSGRFGDMVATISKMSGLKGPSGGERAAIAAVASAGLGERALDDAIKVRGDERGMSRAWYDFNALGDGSKALPTLDNLVTKASSLHDFAIGSQADDVAKRLVEAMEDLKLLISYGKVVTMFATYIKMLQNNLENMHSRSSDSDKAASRRMLDALGVRYDEERAKVDWTKKS